MTSSLLTIWKAKTWRSVLRNRGTVRRGRTESLPCTRVLKIYRVYVLCGSPEGGRLHPTGPRDSAAPLCTWPSTHGTVTQATEEVGCLATSSCFPYPSHGHFCPKGILYPFRLFQGFDGFRFPLCLPLKVSRCQGPPGCSLWSWLVKITSGRRVAHVTSLDKKRDLEPHLPCILYFHLTGMFLNKPEEET